MDVAGEVLLGVALCSIFVVSVLLPNTGFAPLVVRAIGVLFVLGILASAGSLPPAEADLSTGRIRRGRRSIPIAQITGARLLAERDPRTGEGSSLLLVLEGAGGFRVGIVLRRASTILLDDEQRMTLAAVIRRSNISLPRDRFDPQGSFVRHTHPESLRH
jgi:hypothetical protein